MLRKTITFIVFLFICLKLTAQDLVLIQTHDMALITLDLTTMSRTPMRIDVLGELVGLKKLRDSEMEMTFVHEHDTFRKQYPFPYELNMKEPLVELERTRCCHRYITLDSTFIIVSDGTQGRFQIYKEGKLLLYYEGDYYKKFFFPHYIEYVPIFIDEAAQTVVVEELIDPSSFFGGTFRRSVMEIDLKSGNVLWKYNDVHRASVSSDKKYLLFHKFTKGKISKRRVYFYNRETKKVIEDEKASVAFWL